ncbi:carbohydrate esterase family 4 protein [Serendipita vermifera MAFF 305830]|uniref:Carbohydrate esterase family 4 protein n=1 Tax=Serendipita vermifera MAFF 305830 TaxID=933852 RepID=A0A0C3BB64_SERVB|nr:carbohydrate esterase family 4 protein [Serendipita vermifera MAFF 305830]
MKLLALSLPLALLVSVQADTVGSILKRAGVTIQGCTVSKTAALTFDDGPNQYETIIGNTLVQKGVKGTFFVCGNLYHCIYDYKTQLKAVFDQGHQIASHTWSHKDLTTLSDADITNEMAKVDTAIEAITGARPAFMRPPNGNVNAKVSAIAKARGQDVVLWSFDSQDWNGLSAAQSKARYDSAIASNPNTLLALNHETYSGTANDVLPYAIDLLKSKGYKLVTVAECLGAQPYQTTHAPAANISSYRC